MTVQRRCAESGRRQAFSRLALAAARRQGGECGNGQMKPREPWRPQPDAVNEEDDPPLAAALDGPASMDPFCEHGA
jgi:hypothetical protein